MDEELPLQRRLAAILAAAAAVAELLKLRPEFTVQKLVQEGSGTSDNPAFRKEFQRIVEGGRAGAGENILCRFEARRE